jgi:ABC-type nickel/cobalt efflux system permease component RcnA
MTIVAAAVAGGLYGVAHGLGPDHCAALATLIVRRDARDRRAAVRASVRFGVSHALVLGALAAAAALSGWLVPPAWEQALEAIGGALLVVLGAFVIARALPLVIHRHRHQHQHQHDHERAVHAHWHLHVGDPEHKKHDHRHAALVGGAFALSGVRAVAVAVAPLLIAGRSLPAAIAYLIAFGAGVTLAMIAFGLLFQAGRRLLGTGARDVTSLIVGAVSAVLGVGWVVASLQ